MAASDDAQSLQSLAAIFTAIAATKMYRWHSENAKANKKESKRQAFQTYVNTGKKNRSFAILSSRAIKAAEKQRRSSVKERLLSSTEFESMCACPYCAFFEIHSVTQIKSNECIRQCSQCKSTWRQK